MMAPRSNPARRVNAATRWLIRAFAPGCPTLLRSWESARIGHDGELLTIFFDLPDDRAAARAKELERGAKSLAQVRIGKTAVHDLTATISDEHRTLKIEALLALDSPLTAASLDKGGKRHAA